MTSEQSSRTSRKFTNNDLAKVFTGPYREERGKIELSASEITDILNDEILEGVTVTRQAVDKRLNDLVGLEIGQLGGKLQRAQHGRSHLYYRDVDLERVGQNSNHHGRGNPAFTDQEMVSFLLEMGVAKTTEIADEFGVSGPAIRKRGKDMDGVESRKIRNRRVWYVPHEDSGSKK